MLQAAAGFHAAHGGGGWKLRLNKELPVAAGLGGGSADAAATLRLLARLCGVSPDHATLLEIARGLGADVPMCLRSAACMAGGTGELVAPARGLEGLAVLLVNPRVPVRTGRVFAMLNAPQQTGRPPPPVSLDLPRDEWLARIAAARNDLEEPALRLAPVIGEVRAALTGLDGCRVVRMSGSGATMFGLFDSAAAAAAAARLLAARRPAWWARSGPLF